MLVKMQRKGNMHTLLVGLKSVQSLLKKYGGSSKHLRQNYDMTQQFSSSVYIWKKTKTLIWKDTYSNVHGNIICHLQDIEAT